MQVDKNNHSDLEYLAQLGFDKIVVNDADIKELQAKVKSRIFSYNNGSYFGFISLIVGIFIGVSLFFMVDNKPVLVASESEGRVFGDTLSKEKISNDQLIALDTIVVTKENFIHPRVHYSNVNDTSSLYPTHLSDTVMILTPKPINASVILEGQLSESKLKYISNSPIVYIHDLKVTNYTTLYFNRNQYVKVLMKNGIPVNYANKEDYDQNRAGSKQSADYYLHEELSEALLFFKKSNYDQCILKLTAISNYNDEDPNCDFYLGMCYFYKKNYSKANNFFDQCIQSSNNSFFQEASYYRAVSMYENGETAIAKEKFKQIADEGEFYSEKAKTFLKN